MGYVPTDNVGIVNFSLYQNASGLLDVLTLPAHSAAKAVRRELKAYLRYPEAKLPWLRFYSFRSRLMNKLFHKRKKVLPNKGFILVFSGADGVGKSTMSESIGDTYKSFLSVRNVQLGRPQSKFVEAVRKLLSGQKESLPGFTEKGIKKVTLSKALSSVYLAYLRYNAAEKANRYKRKNYLVISDRWPTLAYHKMDGPKLDVQKLSGVIKKLAMLEKKYYDKLVTSDLSIILTVPIEVAVLRNRERIKEGKETDEQIKERHLQNSNHYPKSKEIIRFDNNGDLKTKRFELISLIQSKLFQG
jgi:thymidylate kinase